jgi:hypothetical protein
VTPFVATVAVDPLSPPEAPEGAHSVGATFGDVLRVASVAVGPAASDVLTASVLFEAVGTPATDYTAFIHVLDASGQRVAGYDAAPADARWPTSHWRAGDRIRSDFVIPLPGGLEDAEYAVWLGLYESASGGSVRLPVTDAGGQPSGDGQIELVRVRLGSAGE